MADPAFAAFRDNVFALHAASRFGEALGLVRREAARFPDQWGDISYWQACLAALTGDSAAALGCLQEAVDRGHWWSAQTLRGDSDLHALQGSQRSSNWSRSAASGNVRPRMRPDPAS